MEITKSISLKVNIGNFQSADFFCSAKAECDENNAEAIGEKLHEYCLKEITKDRNSSLKYLKALTITAQSVKPVERDYGKPVKENNALVNIDEEVAEVVG